MGRSGLYVKLDTNFPDDDKIEAVGLAGSGLYAQALCIAKRVVTDGRLSRSKLRKLGADDALIDLLVAEELFTADGEHVWITAWLDHNGSVEQIEAKRAEDAARKRLTRAKRPAGHADTPTPDAGTPSTGHADLEEEEEEEEKRKRNGRPASGRKVAAPTDFTITEAMAAWAASEGIRRDALDRETASFLDHHRSKGTKFVSWDSAWKNWLRRAKAWRPDILVSSAAASLGPQETYR